MFDSAAIAQTSQAFGPVIEAPEVLLARLLELAGKLSLSILKWGNPEGSDQAEDAFFELTNACDSLRDACVERADPNHRAQLEALIAKHYPATARH